MTDEVSNLSGNGDLAMWLCDSGWVPRNDAQWTRIMPLWNEIAQLRAENARLTAENELLRAVADASNDLRMFVAITQSNEPYDEFVHKLLTMAAKIQAAIEGGALTE